MVKKLNSWNEYDLLRALVILAITIYILGIVPQFTDGVRALFNNPLIKIIFLGLIVFVGYLDSTIALLLAVAFLISYMGSPDSRGSPVAGIFDNAQRGGSRLVGGVGQGAGRFVGGLAEGTHQIFRTAGEGTSQIVGGASRGLGEVVGGLGSGAEEILEGAQHVVGGLTKGTQQFITGASQGAQTFATGFMGGIGGVASDVGAAAQQTIGAASGATQALLGNGEQFTQGAPLSVADAYKQNMRQGDKNCSVPPQLGSGCDPIVGYNASYKCDKNCQGKDPTCLCTGVANWENELNAQGMNSPQGYAGDQVGSTF